MLRLILRAALVVLLLVALMLAALRYSAARREAQFPEALMPDAGRFIETASGRVYILSEGPDTGKTVLLAHGTAAWSGFWQSEISALGRAGYHAIAFDMPPFGFSDRAADGDYSRQRQAQRLLDLVAVLDEAPVLVAHSFGAAAATEAVLQRPDAFAGLIIVNGALGMDTDTTDKSLPLPLRPRIFRETAIAATATNPRLTRRLLKGLLHRKAAATERQIRILQLPQRRIGTTRAYAEWLPSLLAPDPNALSRDPASYSVLALPVRLIWGDMDTVTPPAQAEALAAAIGQQPVHYLKDVGHIPHIEAPKAFQAALLKTLEEMD